ncbi:MAG: bifunctional diaminohydroxyphosphoribosylaminopyrimidine deaminase/5-amino-6-(5-phosphoribosylamino)uracil reductase RibD [Methanoregulaceae archaeon]|nr:bifunctional diaminohydroxyphosphoribosylaminopyrimidine deaminase/5-amino-6-(5-phosphoribosylamino)uracil reductase RibD [Methanoregulaceae archaeon]
MTDLEAMARAIRLAGRGYPAPNPRVGCVIVRDGLVIGEGWHEAAGRPHAEVMALANGDAKGATAYVTLEPCNHHGRTPPCAEALIEAGVSRVVVAVEDPNPEAAGGVARLRAAGIAVDVGVAADRAAVQNERFLTAMRLRRAFVTIKVAMGLDGRIALPSGESKWITGPAARREGHRLRAEMGAVLVGKGTLLADNPYLTARIPGVVNPPTRVVLDPQHDLPRDLNVFNEAAPTVVFSAGRFSPQDIAAMLFSMGHTGLLVEGGAGMIGSFLQADVVDALEVFVAPKLLGHGKTWLEVPLLDRLDEPARWRLRRTGRRGEDVQLSYRRRR